MRQLADQESTRMLLDLANLSVCTWPNIENLSPMLSKFRKDVSSNQDEKAMFAQDMLTLPTRTAACILRHGSFSIYKS